MVGWTVLLAVFCVMLLFALSVVITSKRMHATEENDELE